MSHFPSGLVSVIVPCRDQLAFTRECVRALFDHTSRPWELIVVDDGSTDGTALYATALLDSSPVPVRAIRQPWPLGFPSACNAGWPLRAASSSSS